MPSLLPDTWGLALGYLWVIGWFSYFVHVLVRDVSNWAADNRRVNKDESTYTNKNK